MKYGSKDAVVAAAQAAGSTASTWRGARRYILDHVIPRAGSHAPANGGRKTTRAEWYRSGHAHRAALRYESLAASMCHSLRLPTRDALVAIKRLPSWLTATECRILATPRAAIATWRSRPLYARAYFSAPTGLPAKEIALAEKHKGQLLNSTICGNYADRNYSWGGLRVHGPGECVEPGAVGTRKTGSNSNWNKRSTLDRRTNYCLIYPARADRETDGAWTGYLVTPTASGVPHRHQIIHRSAHFLLIAGSRYDIAAAKPDAKRVLPAQVQRRILRQIAPSDIVVTAGRTTAPGRPEALTVIAGEITGYIPLVESSDFCAYFRRELRSVLAHPARLANDLYVLPGDQSDIVVRYDAAGARTGVAVRQPDGSWEHGTDRAECDRETARKADIVARREREARVTAKQQRRERLFARLATVPVSVQMVRAEGACMAGIESWCRARQVNPDARLPLRDLFRDRAANYYAIRIARRVLAISGRKEVA